MFQEIIELIAKELAQLNLPYMLIGGQAVLLYGEPRLTRDIDITIGISPDQYTQIIQLSNNLGFKVLVADPEKFINQTMVLPCQESKSGIRIDFIFSFSPYENEALKRVNKQKVGSTLVAFASIEDLIIHKLVAGRERDIDDVKSIIPRNQNIDFTYIENWLKEFSTLLDKNLVKKLQECKNR